MYMYTTLHEKYYHDHHRDDGNTRMGLMIPSGAFFVVENEAYQHADTKNIHNTYIHTVVLICIYSV